jgi:hypothetical protein
VKPGNEIPKDYRTIVDELVSNQGWRYDNSGHGHPKLFAPSGARMIPVPTTPSDQRGLRNFISQVRRAGAIWPPGRKADDA